MIPLENENDMRIDKIEFPTKELATDNLAGSLSSAKRIDAPRSRSFVFTDCVESIWQRKF